MMQLESALKKFYDDPDKKGKGPLSVMIVITDEAIQKGLPLNPDSLLTKAKGQVKGLSMSRVQKVLKKYGIRRILAREAGRTSRGSIKNMRDYVALLNALHEKNMADLKRIEKWWADRVQEFFLSKPFQLKLDPSKSLRSIIKDLINQAVERQKEASGTMYAGAVMQHLVGAKLALMLPEASIKQHGFSVADSSTARNSDFMIEDVAMHVTSAPTEALIKKCVENLEASLQPVIVTTSNGAGGAESLSVNSAIDGRIDIFEIEQFMATNFYEWSKFNQSKRRMTIEKLLDAYNKIISECETDPSLKIILK